MSESPRIVFRQAHVPDWDGIKALLVEANLPIEDLGPDKLDEFVVAENESDPVGLIGLQKFGTIGLLRSLVVGEAARGCGLGGSLVAGLESRARLAGITELWLLTIDAEKFFGHCGFQIETRDNVPASIRQTAEFSKLCPGSAFLMKKVLR